MHCERCLFLLTKSNAIPAMLSHSSSAFFFARHNMNGLPYLLLVCKYEMMTMAMVVWRSTLCV